MKREVTTISFGGWLKEKRRAAKKKQYELAKEIPVNANTLSRYETGERLPTLDVAERICELFGAEIIIREKGIEGE